MVDKFINDFIQYKIGNPMNWRNTLHIKCWAVVAALVGGGNFVSAQVAAVPDRAVLSRPFTEQDRSTFRQPDKIY